MNERLKEGTKLDAGKERYDLIPTEPLKLLAKLYTVGTIKYEDHNYRKGIKYSRIYSAIQRHLNRFWSGEDIDEETGVPHVINAAWGCFALAEYMKTRKEFDDRYEKKEAKKDSVKN